MNWRMLWRQTWRFERPRLLSAQMQLLDRNLSYAFAISTLMVWLTAAMAARFVYSSWVWPWAVAVTAVTAACLVWRELLPRPCDPLRVVVYAHAVRVIAGILGLCWGAMAVLVVDPAKPQSIAIVFGMLAGINSGGLAVFSPSWPVAVVYLLCNMLPVPVMLLSSHDELGLWMSVAGTSYMLGMGLFAYHAAQGALQAIHIGFENEGLVARLRDQTQRALEARQVAELAQSEAEESNRAKTVFLASASHDLRQPLHAMGLFLSALALEALSGKQHALLTHAQASALATGEMLTTLMDFSRVDAGVIVPQTQTFALQNIFQKLEREMAPVAEGKGLAFRMRDTSLVLQADPALVEMILRNLVLNAIRYTDQGGILMACRRRGQRAVLEVWDTGVGIPAHQHQAIFREFHQLGNPERDRRKGLGLGLAIVEGLARAMSVDVSLRSSVGRGSVFRLGLPISETPWAAQAPGMQDEPDLSGLRVLLIDDDISVCEAFSNLLAGWGCWCETATTCEDALRVLDTFEPDVLLSDYRLRSHGTGLQAVQMVRERLGRCVPAAIITGDTGPERLREAYASGLILMHKPVAASRLATVLFSLWRETPELDADLASTTNSAPI